MSHARLDFQSYPYPFFYHSARLLDAGVLGITFGDLLKKADSAIPEQIGAFPLAMAFTGMAFAMNARAGDFLRLVLTAPHPLTAMKEILMHYGCNHALRGTIIFAVKEMLALGVSMSSAIALVTLAHAQTIFNLNAQDIFFDIVKFPLTIPAMLGSFGYFVHVGLSYCVQRITDKLNLVQHEDFEALNIMDDSEEDEAALARCQYAQTSIRKALSLLLEPMGIGLIAREILKIRKQMRALGSTKFLSYFSIVQPILEVINTLAFSKKTIPEIIDDSVSEMWGQREGKRFPYFALYHGLRNSFSIGMYIATVQLSQQLAVSMGDSPKAIESLWEYLAILFASYVSQTFATEVVFDTAFKKAVYRPVSNQRNAFFSHGQTNQNDLPTKHALLSATDEEASPLGDGQEDDPSSIKSSEQDEYPVVLKRRASCGIV